MKKNDVTLMHLNSWKLATRRCQGQPSSTSVLKVSILCYKNNNSTEADLTDYLRAKKKKPKQK